MIHTDFTTGTRFFQSDTSHPDFDKVQVVTIVKDNYVFTNLRPDGFGLFSDYALTCKKL